MPALSSHGGFVALEAREWRDTVGQSGMTPTAFSFLIPVFVVAIAAPFLCIFCIRKRRQGVPAAARSAPKPKKPALRRAEARERLLEVTDVSNVSDSLSRNGDSDNSTKREVETRSMLERECAICLSTLHAPAPPEPAKLSPETPITDEAALPSSSTLETTPTQEADKILKLRVCGHEFHAECLVSWFVLRKTSCPICRSSYMSKEALEEYDEEERIALGQPANPTTVATAAAIPTQPPTPGPVVSNWRYFFHGHNVVRNQIRADIEMNARTPGEGVEHTQGETTPVTQEQPRRPRWLTIWRS